MTRKFVLDTKLLIGTEPDESAKNHRTENTQEGNKGEGPGKYI